MKRSTMVAFVLVGPRVDWRPGGPGDLVDLCRVRLDEAVTAPEEVERRGGRLPEQTEAGCGAFAGAAEAFGGGLPALLDGGCFELLVGCCGSGGGGLDCLEDGRSSNCASEDAVDGLG